MSLLLDTNVISELVRPAPDAAVVAWAAAQSPLDLHLSVLTLGEIEQGIARLPNATRRARLEQWARTDVPRQFAGRVLPIEDAVAIAWGTLSAAGRRSGRPLPVVDGLLLATAQHHGLTLVTRNVADCAGRGVAVFDPWSGTLHR